MPRTDAEWKHRRNLSNNGMPRLPVFFCLDTSSSMNTIIRELSSKDIIGGGTGYADGRKVTYVTGSHLVTRLDELKRGLESFYRKLMTDYTTKYSVEMAVITFDDRARCRMEVSSLDDINIVEAKALMTGDKTCMGEGLNMALDMIENCIGLYKEYDLDNYVPWLIFMSDGEPNGREDELRRAIKRIADMTEKSALVMRVIGIGREADRTVLRRLSPNGHIDMLHDVDINYLFGEMIQQAKRKAFYMPADEFYDTEDIPQSEEWEEYTTYGSKLSFQNIGTFSKMNKVKILFAGSNPSNDCFIRLDKEAQAIQNEIMKTKYRDNLEFVSQIAMQTSELQDALRKNNPAILHFSGHGSIDGNLIFESESQGEVMVSPSVMAETLRLASGTLRLVLFNACYSVEMAKQASQYVDVAIGMSGEIQDESAKIFSAQFYAALGDGCTVRTAYEQAKNELNLQNVEGAELPQLFVRAGIDVEQMTFNG